MKILVLAIGILSISLTARAQATLPAGYLKLHRLPEDSTYSALSLARHFTSAYTSPTSRIAAIYDWVKNNIVYNTDSVYYFNTSPDMSLRVSAALRRKKGVCENFASVFDAIVEATGTRCVVISGYTKQAGGIDRAGHSWCAVELDGKWLFADPTWDAARADNRYFLLSPEEFITTHMPFDPLWQLLPSPISHKAFIQGDLLPQQGHETDVKGAVNTHLQLQEIDQLRSANERIAKAGTPNELVRIEALRTNMEIEIIYQEADMKAYNAAVEDLNNARKKFNEFITLRNNSFMSSRSPEEPKQLLTAAESSLSSARQNLYLVKGSKALLQLEHSLLEEQMDKFEARLTEQRSFLSKYLGASGAEQHNLLYQSSVSQ